MNKLEIEPSQHEQHSQEAIELLEFKPCEDTNGFKVNSNEDKRFNLKRIAAQLTEEGLKMGMKNQTEISREVELAITCVIISLMFVVCQIVKLVADIYELAVCDHFKLHKNGYDPSCQNNVTIDIFMCLGNLFSCINSASNFLLYMIKGKIFRDAFCKTYFWWKK